MGGEGSMMGAINSLKNNRSLLARRKEKGALSGSYSSLKLKEFPEATPELLNEIKNKIKQDNKRIRVKQLIVFGLIFLIITSIFFFNT